MISSCQTQPWEVPFPKTVLLTSTPQIPTFFNPQFKCYFNLSDRQNLLSPVNSKKKNLVNEQILHI